MISELREKLVNIITLARVNSCTLLISVFLGHPPSRLNKANVHTVGLRPSVRQTIKTFFRFA